MMEKPKIQYRTEPAEKSMKFFIKMLAVFFVLVKPASTKAKPGCMKNTSMAAIKTQTVSNGMTGDSASSAAASTTGATASAAAGTTAALSGSAINVAGNIISATNKNFVIYDFIRIQL